MHVIVIGAGVIGSTTALALAERGVGVTLIEHRDAPAADTSHANGGGVTPGHSEPWNSPALLPNLMRHLGRPNAPYRVSPLALPGMGRWGLRFLANTRKARFVANAQKNIRLGMYSLRCLRALRERRDIDYHQSLQGSMQVYFSDQAMKESFELRHQLLAGETRVEPIDPDEAIRREPALEPVRERLAGALYFPDHESGDAARFSRAVAELAERKGAQLRFNTAVRAIGTRGGRFARIRTDDEVIEADQCVVAAGPDAPGLLKPLGVRLPIYPVRGYSATFELDDPASAPHMPMLDTTSRFVTLRLGEHRLRIAGLADFAGYRRDIPHKRMRSLLRGAAQLLPRLETTLVAERAELWAGLRPVTPDGVPLLGETAIGGLFVNAGHGHMGWTMACGSAEITADLVTGKEPAMDVDGFDVNRF